MTEKMLYIYSLHDRKTRRTYKNELETFLALDLDYDKAT